MSKRISQLAQFVRDDRERRKLTQVAYEELLKAPKNYVSKVETGAISEPSFEFLTELGKLTKRSLELLRSWTRVSAEGIEPLTMAFGHTLWGASIYLAVLRGLQDLRCFSYCKKTQYNEFRPAFIVPSDALDRSSNDVADVQCVSRAASADEIEVLSAVDVIRLLNQGQIEIGAVPSNLIKGNPDFLSVARIVDSTCCCIMLCGDQTASKYFSPDGARSAEGRANGEAEVDPPGSTIVESPPWRDHPIGSRAFGEAIKKSATKWRFAAEAGTISIEFLRDAALYALPNASRLERSMFIDDSLVKCDSNRLARESFDGLFLGGGAGVSPDHQVVLTWEPQASWLVQRHKEVSGTSLRYIPVYFSFGDDHPPQSLTFDIVIRRRDSGNRRLRDAILGLISELFGTTATLLGNQNSDFTEDLLLLSRYFGVLDAEAQLTPSQRKYEMLKSLNTIRFVTYVIYERTLDFMGGAADGGT